MSSKENKNIETPEEKQEHDELLQKIQEIDKKLAMFQQASGEIKPEEQTPELGEIPVINKRGQKVISTEEMKERYEQGYPFLRILNLPYCANSIYGKSKFWLIGGAVAAFTWEYKKNLENKLTLKDLTMKRFLKRYAVITLAGIAFSVFESVMFDPFCDINSYHYNQKIANKLKIQRLKCILCDLSKNINFFIKLNQENSRQKHVYIE